MAPQLPSTYPRIAAPGIPLLPCRCRGRRLPPFAAVGQESLTVSPSRPEPGSLAMQILLRAAATRFVPKLLTQTAIVASRLSRASQGKTAGAARHNVVAHRVLVRGTEARQKVAESAWLVRRPPAASFESVSLPPGERLSTSISRVLQPALAPPRPAAGGYRIALTAIRKTSNSKWHAF